MTFTPFAPPMQKQATTGQGGYTLVNGTGAIFTWTAPADGQMHLVVLYVTLRVTSAETGGQLTLACTTPDGLAYSPNFLSGQAAGGHQTEVNVHVESGSTVTFEQSTALTAGAAELWADLWAA